MVKNKNVIKKSNNLKEALNSLKGMNDIMGETYYQFQGMFEKAQEISEYYGFKPLETPALEREEIFLKTIGDGTDIVEKEMYAFKVKNGHRVALRPEFTSGIMRSYIEHGMSNLPQPVMFYSFGKLWRHDNPQKGRLREFRQFNLEILGSKKPMADAVVIRTLVTILKEFGFKDLVIDINSMGDEKDRANFTKELTTYYKKHIGKMCKDCQSRITTNPLRLLDCKDEKCAEFKELAPTTLSFLSTESKKHFRDVLQYLEEMGIEYRINNSLVRGLDYYTHTVFEIIKIQKEPIEAEGEVSIETDTKDGEKNTEVKIEAEEKFKVKELSIVGGGRYNKLAERLGSKKEIPAIGAALGIDRLALFEECKDIHPKILKKPKVYFLQLGFEAKLKSLNIMEILRENKIPVYHTLSKESLSTQLAQASEMKIPYCIIFGQKEAMDNTVIVRDMKTYSQQVVKIDELSEYIKNLK